jgi:2-iminoacetate synthase
MNLPDLATDTDPDFINDAALELLLARPAPDQAEVTDLLARSLAKEPLTVAQTARLCLVTDPEQIARIHEAARRLKREVYGNRIVLFAPLYIGNKCVNDCAYCGFRSTNGSAVRRTLDRQELIHQVEALEDKGHKRLVLVYGEHPDYDADVIADSVRTVYGVKRGHGEIRRVNINAAPMDEAGYRTVKAAGIGTWQIFQETYHHATYARLHPAGTRKADYRWRLTGLGRAMRAGCDDVGLGALFGLYDWRFEVLGLISHAAYLRDCYRCGPHTISFPRLRPASGMEVDPRWQVSDDDMLRIIAILRLAVPYTGLILTAREPAALRRQAIAMGVSQIDAGSRIEIGGYTECGDAQVQVAEREQFQLGDLRSLDEVIADLLGQGEVPSFCTGCYRLGRTGEHFMEYAVPGFIRKFCTPNALTTLQEYLCDYASAPTRALGQGVIALELAKMPKRNQGAVRKRLEAIRAGTARDLYV